MLKTRTWVVLLNLALAAARTSSLALTLACPGQPIPWVSLLQGLQILAHPLGQVTRPVVHQDASALE